MRQSVLAYLDYIVLYSRSFEELLCHLTDFLGRLRAADITINPAQGQKCSAQVSLLGYRTEQGKMSRDPEKLQGLLEITRPNDLAGVRRFLGMIDYYRQFIPACERLQVPLTSLLRKSGVMEVSELGVGAVLLQSEENNSDPCADTG